MQHMCPEIEKSRSSNISSTHVRRRRFANQLRKYKGRADANSWSSGQLGGEFGEKLERAEVRTLRNKHKFDHLIVNFSLEKT